MDFENLRIFVEVIRRGSFAAVARDRNVDPYSVSRAVASLEEELGARLIQRSTRRMGLTEAGNLFFGRVEVLVDGAHAVAHIDFNIKDLGCDYYGSSLHSC